jgi:transcriptional regulator GlxA family with amidase domain
MHGSPEHPWSVAELARRTAVSRSVLDERFRQVLGESPIRYLTQWRMHLAADLLATTDLTVHDIARRAGYQSEEAFSRAFKRQRGQPPAHWRSSRR